MYNYTDEDRYSESFGGVETESCPLCTLSIDDPSEFFALSTISGEPMYGGICRDCANALLREVVDALAGLTPAQMEEVAAVADTTYLSTLAHSAPTSPAFAALVEVLSSHDADELMVIDAMTDGEYLPDLVAVLHKPVHPVKAA